MPYNVIICDDDNIQVRIINGYLNRFSDGNNLFNILSFNSGEELLHKLSKNSSSLKVSDIDIFLLDIEMSGLNGMELGYKIREVNKTAIIIYITGFKDYALNAFEIRSFNYIIKPISYEKFYSVISEAMEIVSLKIEKSKELVIDNKDKVHRIRYDDIYYFEKYLRKVRVITKQETIEYYASLKELKKVLDMDYFVQCHQSFIINKSKLTSYKSQSVYIADLGIDIPVSKASVKEVRQCLANNLFG
ncbi:LytR/AlgR family response regulator transcription factor [Clostridium sp. UBA6640]|uniref:LytR/AlgR family response regulator transcription factor n=1 Tax=Clostridium sp. UBA6640 TaxID=1946370 RepID=UPI0025C6B3BC|nr:LytTR family DNA-binding domain-containing protein [Clostridium sp. UBA6640]